MTARQARSVGRNVDEERRGRTGDVESRTKREC